MIKTRNLLITMLLLGAFVISGCGKSNGQAIEIQPLETFIEVEETDSIFNMEYTSADDILFDMAVLNQGELPTIYTTDDNQIYYLDGILSDKEINDASSALNFLESIKLLFNIQDMSTNYRLVKVINETNYEMYVFEQIIPGTDYIVEGSCVSLTVRNHIPVNVSGLYREIPQFDLNKMQDVNKIQANFAKEYGEEPIYIATYVARISRDNGLDYCLVDSFSTYTEKGDLLVLIDAISGEVLSEENVSGKLTEDVTLSTPGGVNVSAELEKANSGYELKDYSRKPYIEIRYKDEYKDSNKYASELNNARFSFLGIAKDKTNVKKYGVDFFERWNDKIDPMDSTDLTTNATLLLDTAQRVYDAYADTLGYYSIDGKGNYPMLLSINPNELFGCSALSPYPYDKYIYVTEDSGYLYGCLTAIVHEYQHAVSFYQGGMGIDSAVDEGYSDVFACLMEGYSDGNTDWIIADYTDQNGQYHDGIRSLIVPQNYKVGNTVFKSDFNDVPVSKTSEKAYEYLNSTVFSHAAYLIYEGVDGQKGFKDLYDSKDAFYKMIQIYYASLKYNTIRDYDNLNLKHAATAVYKSAAHELNCTREEMQIMERAFIAVNLAEQEAVASPSLMERIVAYQKEHGIEAETNKEDTADTNDSDNTDASDYGELIAERAELKYVYSLSDIPTKENHRSEYDNIEITKIPEEEFGTKGIELFRNISESVSFHIDLDRNDLMNIEEFGPLMDEKRQYFIDMLQTDKATAYDEGDATGMFYGVQDLDHAATDLLPKEETVYTFSYNGYTYTFEATWTYTSVASTCKFEDDGETSNGLDISVHLQGKLYRK